MLLLMAERENLLKSICVLPTLTVYALFPSLPFSNRLPVSCTLYTLTKFSSSLAQCIKFTTSQRGLVFDIYVTSLTLGNCFHFTRLLQVALYELIARLFYCEVHRASLVEQ